MIKIWQTGNNLSNKLSRLLYYNVHVSIRDVKFCQQTKYFNVFIALL